MCATGSPTPVTAPLTSATATGPPWSVTAPQKRKTGRPTTPSSLAGEEERWGRSRRQADDVLRSPMTAEPSSREKLVLSRLRRTFGSGNESEERP
jgi:hypothetical protein